MKLLVFSTADDPTPRAGVLAGSVVVDLSGVVAQQQIAGKTAPNPTADVLGVLNRTGALNDEITGYIEDVVDSGGGIAENEITYLPPVHDPGKFLPAP